MPVTVVLGEQRGDEGKGRFVDMLAAEHDIGARFNGGDNAGHTVALENGEIYKLHGLPTTIIHPHTKSVIGNGTVINPMRLDREMRGLEAQGIEISPDNLLISSGAHLTLPSYISQDEIRETGTGKQGSTKSGIAQAYAAKYMRTGLRAESINNEPSELFEAVREGLLAQRELRRAAELDSIDEEVVAEEYMESALKLGEYITFTALFLNSELRKSKPARVLAEGAQAFSLDIDHGMYPFTTSSSTTSGGVATGLGIAPQFIDRVIGVSKATQSHVGGGPFVTEVTDPEMFDRLHGDKTTVDAEVGTTTGRTRRLGHLDLPQIRESQMINGTDEMALTKLDWVPRYGETVLICVAYERKGKRLDISPDAAYKLDQSTPIYEALPTWEEDIQDVRVFNDLPKNAQNYIEFIERQTGVPITLIGVGPERDQYIKRPK